MIIETQQFGVFPKPWTPHDYQKRGIRFLLSHAAGGLLLDPSMGKTSITLAAIKILKKKGLLNRVLLVCPLRPAYQTWPKELYKWQDFHGLTYQLLHGPDKAEALKADADIFIINPEGLEWLLDIEKIRNAKNRVSVKLDVRRFKGLGFDTLVVDELSKFKHIQSTRFKAMKPVLHTFARRWGLTGSPAANGLMGLFGECFMLDEGRTFGPYISHYRNKYYVPGYDGYTWNLREGADDEIYARIRPLMLRLDAEDYLELPELVYNDIWVDLPPDVRSIYDEMEKDLLTKINDRAVVAVNSGVASGKCRQIANGGVYLEPAIAKLVRARKQDREWVNLHTEKIDALADLIEELEGNPLLVAYDFEHDLDRLRGLLGKDVPYVGAGLPPKRGLELERLWNQGKLPVLLAHPQSMAHGLNMQECGYHICWHSLTYDYELYDQLIWRIRRQGSQAKRVFVHHLLARDTVDIDILAALQSKKKGQNALFAALKKRLVTKYLQK